MMTFIEICTFIPDSVTVAYSEGQMKQPTIKYFKVDQLTILPFLLNCDNCIHLCENNNDENNNENNNNDDDDDDGDDDDKDFL